MSILIVSGIYQLFVGTIFTNEKKMKTKYHIETSIFDICRVICPSLFNCKWRATGRVDIKAMDQ